MSRMDEIYFGLVQSYSKLQAENAKLKEELAAAHQAGYNQCLKELSEREPDIIVTEQIAYDYALIENQPLIVRPAYPKE